MANCKRNAEYQLEEH